MNYDDWKLSNPIDDGHGYNMVSDCCGVIMDEDIHICPECYENCDPTEDYEHEAIQRENYEEERAEAKRKYNE